MTSYVEREVVEYVLPLKRGVTHLCQKNVVLRFGEGGPSIDFGAHCYLKRSSSVLRRNRRGWGSPVDPNSFDKARAKKIRELVSYLSEEVESSGKSLASLHRHTADFFQFIDWCDAIGGHQEVLENAQHARSAFRAYVEHLRDRVLKDELNVNTAAKYQNSVAILLGPLQDVDDLGRGIRLLRVNKRMTQTTPPPDEDAQGKVLGLCEIIFGGISCIVLDLKPYPFKLAMPAYLGWKDNFLWVFPTVKWFMAPHELAGRHELGCSSWAMDYANGQLANLEEIVQYYSVRQSAKNSLRNAEESIAAANSDSQHFRRRDLAMVAHNAFVLMFVANTGMNWAEVRKLPWDADYEVGLESQGFREIKLRAGGKLVSFRIETSFLSKFKRYLNLRTYLLSKHKCDLLFFSLGANISSAPKPMGESLFRALYLTLRRIDPSLPKVLSRAWRAAKSDWAIRNTDPSTAALLLQNTERTVLRHYATGSETRATEEMGSFFERLSEVVLNADQKIPPKGIDGALGECTKYGAPNPTEDGAPIKPDCHQPEGCLFCDKYVVHADERDARKLISCRYCIEQTAHLSASDEHFQILFGKVIRRINAILDHIRGRSNEHAGLVDRVMGEVEDKGLLDPYWESKLEMLIGLGVVSQ